MKNWLMILSAILLCGSLQAQEAEDQKEKKVYHGVIEDSVNVLQMDSHLIPFFEKLHQLENGEIDRINIVQIGDSHIQADWQSGTIRVELQRKFGNAGRGLVFPYKVAGSNSPPDIYSYSNETWTAYRNLHRQNEYEVGLSGYVIGSTDSSAVLKLSLNDKHDMGGYGFNKITLFHPEDDNHYDFRLSVSEVRDVLEENTVKEEGVSYKVQSGDYLGKIADKFKTTAAKIRAMNGLNSDMIYAGQKLTITQKLAVTQDLPVDAFDDLTVLAVEEGTHYTKMILDTTVEFTFIRNEKIISSQNQSQWDGFSLEHTDSTGILYHMIGVNGAQYFHYNKTELFFDQLSVLEPDLILMSLGTNEALNTDLKDDKFQADVSEFYTNLHESLGDVPVIVATPPDNRKQQTNAENIARLLRGHAYENQIALYDMYNILGGKGSFYDLQMLGFARKDKIHFHAEGYVMQGQLISDALLKSYENYKLTLVD